MLVEKLRENWYQMSDKAFYEPTNFYFISITYCYSGRSTTGGERLPPIICETNFLAQEIKLIDN